MGYLAEGAVMDAKRAFSFGSTGNLTSQHIIHDHMMSHYKKIYSAKAAVDCSIPKSMRHSIKYIDQKRLEQLKKGMSERSQSANALSQRSCRFNTMTPCSSKISRPLVRGEEGSHSNLKGSFMSSPRLNTSFRSKQIVYSSQITTSSQNCRPASELSYRSPYSQWQHYTPSCTTSASQNFKSFQDPTQKTYSGDILLKHAHRFTQEKPFMPRTLKSNCKSTLSSYRYYTPPRRKGTEEKNSSRFQRQDTYHGSTHNKQESSEGQDSPQPYSLEHEWSDEESYVLGHNSKTNKFRDNDLFLTSSRVSPEGMRSPTMRKVTAEEEELLYLEFIADVTNEIIARGIYSDSVLGRVFERYIDMNRHRLDEGKMRHLLDVLQNDLQSPPAAPVKALGKKDKDSLFLRRHTYSSLGEELTLLTTDDTTLLSCTPFDKDTRQLETTSLNSLPVTCSASERAGPEEDNSTRQEYEKDQIDLELDHKERTPMSSSLDNHQLSEVEQHHNFTVKYEFVKELDELGKNIVDSLTLSETHGSQEFIEQDSTVKLSDDEF